MLHCWQPKHKYALNCCQAGRSRKSSVSGFTALEKRRLPQPARAHRELLALPQALLLGARGETLRRLPTAPGGSWKGKPLEGFSMRVQNSEGPKGGEKPRDLCGAGVDALLCACGFAAGLRDRSGGVLSCGGLLGAALCGSLISLPRHITMQITGIDSAALAAAAARPCLSPGATAGRGMGGSTGLGPVLVWVRKGLSSPKSPGLIPWETITNRGQVLHGNSG